MRYIRNALLLCAFSVIAACSENKPTSPQADPQPLTLHHDVHSYAEPDKAAVTHVSLDLAPDFTARTRRTVLLQNLDQEIFGHDMIEPAQGAFYGNNTDFV